MSALERRSLPVRNDLAEVARVIAAIDAICDAHGVAAGVKSDVTLAVDEILSNVIRHGEPEEKIEVRIAVFSNRIDIEIEDDGKAFNPLTVPLPNFDVPIEERRPGGMGIFLTKHMMSELSYRRVHNRNVLTMRKLLPADAAHS